jgi:hypothetical protein
VSTLANNDHTLIRIYRDWKKLTFYYFADSYINFNSLVTDLFKIYKTRIWMSAINPASFVTPPSAGLQHSNTLYNQESQADRSHQHDNAPYSHARDTAESGREAVGNPLGLVRNTYPDSFQSFGQGSRMPESGLGGLASADPFAPYSPHSFGGLDSSYADYATSPGGSSGPPRMHPGPGDWVNRFQGLSLGS